MITSAIKTESAKAALRDEETCATACTFAIETLLGEGWRLWEPETVWLELDRQGVAVEEGNRAQILAARSLLTTGRFWYDAIVFEKTCIAFNNEEPNYDALDDAPVMYITWASREAQIINEHFEDETLEFDREVVEYTAVQLFREGFILAPDQLPWAQERLDRYYPKEHRELKQKVKEEWAATPRNDLLGVAYPETPVGVQLARLASVHTFYEQRKERLRKDLAKLTA